MKLNHSITEIKLHLVLVAKKRIIWLDKWLIHEQVINACHSADVKIITIGMANNHCHLLLEFDPVRPVCKQVEIIKSVSSFKLGKLDPEWSGWRTGYFLNSVGSKSISRVKKYIENQ
jgi:putative transposase